VKTHTIRKANGKPTKINIVRDVVIEGYSETPNRLKKSYEMYVAGNLTAQREMEVAIHEFTHAYRGQHVTEPWVQGFAKELQRFLFRWGYRRARNDG